MIGGLETTHRYVELYKNSWLFNLPQDFIKVYVGIAPHVFCSKQEVSTYDEDECLNSFAEQPAVIYDNGSAEWWSKRGNYHSCLNYLSYSMTPGDQ